MLTDWLWGLLIASVGINIAQYFYIAYLRSFKREIEQSVTDISEQIGCTGE